MTTRHPPRLLRLVALLALAGFFSVGCEMEQRVISSSWDQWRDLEWADQPRPREDGSGSRETRPRGYAVELGRVSGADASQEVFNLITRARQDAGLANLWYASAGRDTVVYAGRFRDPEGDQARATLRRARAATIDGDRPFEDAKLVALSRTGGEVLDARDLRSLKGRNLYTLQIGFYDARFGDDFRRAAETAVDVLRDQGEDAYYYHGPNRSMVLVNAWSYGQAFTREGVVDRYSNVVRAAQAKHPYNVPNGVPFDDSDDPEYVESQKSFLVPIR